MHSILRHRHNLMRHLRLIEGGEPQGGAGEPPAVQNTDGEGDDAKNAKDDQSKEFSHALAARVEQERQKIEAKYADYADLKAKADKYDQGESDNQSKLEETNKALKEARTTIEELERQTEALKAKEARTILIAEIAKDTGLDTDIIARLQGDGDELKANAKALADTIAPNHGLPTPPPAGHAGRTGTPSPLQLISQAYAAAQ